MGSFHILYLDSDNYIASQVKMRLEWKGYQVVTASSEQELLTKRVQQQPYDLLIIDFFTPALNAFSFLGYLKGQNIAPPTIIVNTENDPQLMSKAIHLGCIDYVIKDPLIQNFIEQLSLSIFQSITKIQFKKTEKKNKPSRIQSLNKNKVDSTSNWEYVLSKETVQWFPAFNSRKQTISYNEFTSKIHLDDIAHVKTQNNICLFSKTPVEYSFRYLSDSNLVTTFHASIKADSNHFGVVKRLYGSLKASCSQQLSDQNLRLKLSFLEHTEDGIFITDANKKIISINDAFTSISGYSEHITLTKPSSFINTEQFDTQFFNHVAKTLKNKHFWQGEISIRHQKGHSIPIWQSIYILKDNTGNIYQTISVLRDITKQKEAEDSIKLQANFDPLTQLPNRTLFSDRLNNALHQSKRNQKKIALMLLDLNKFKWVNDNLGHHVGDILLQETAKKLLSAVRSSDTVARLGGDEFCIILPELEKTTDAELIARKIFNSFKKPLLIEQKEIFISGSIGISIFPDDGENIELLQKNADSAMYIAKKNGDNSFYYYTQALQEKTEKRLQLITDMQSAILNQEFTLHYQPIIDLHTNKVSSAETLLRWNHPKLGFIPLMDFIPVAEECGLIHEIGNWVVQEIANNMQRWSKLGLPPLHISLNQSVAQYSQPECHVEWLEILKSKKISPHNITFEIPEKIFIEEQNSHLNSIEKLKQQGIQFSLDSFGTGYSSLSYLKKFHVDVIKIDRSYIHKMIDDPTHAILVETIIILAKKLNIKVVATGVENQEQLNLLDKQCSYAQGYFFSKPLAINEFEAFIKDQLKNEQKVRYIR